MTADNQKQTECHAACRHGLFIGMERLNEHFFLSLKARGRLSQQDYSVIGPVIENALAGIQQQDLRLLVDGTEIDSWESGALWAELKLALKHGPRFSRIAIVGDKRWQRMAGRFGSWFLEGQVRQFKAIQPALGWLTE